ncbi:hypothetical protein M9458_027298, partial [Cirrhinus mrigala]
HMHDDNCISALLFPGVLLLGFDRSMAVLYGRDGKSSDQAHPETLPLLGMG